MSEPKFKLRVGDRVTVRPDIKDLPSIGPGKYPPMEALAGRTFTITSVDDDQLVAFNGFWWAPEWILPASEKERAKYKAELKKQKKALQAVSVGHITVHVNVHNRLIRERDIASYEEYPRVFMLGKNKSGVVVDAVRLASGDLDGGDDGCDQMPDINPGALAKGIIALSKKKLVQCGFARASGNTRARWSATSGPAIRQVAGSVFITYGTDVLQDKKETTAHQLKADKTVALVEYRVTSGRTAKSK